MLSHIDWSVERGCERIIVLSNDTNTVVLLLRHITAFFKDGLQEMWVEFGTREHRRKIPLHCLHAKLGEHFCNILLKAHVLSGNAVDSKIGTKYAAITCNPLSLNTFAENDSLTETDISVIEHYLVKLWTGVRPSTTVKTFDELIHHFYLNGKPLNELPLHLQLSMDTSNDRSML